MELAGLTWTEAADLGDRVAVVPLGSLEQHGPHLPLDTDTRIAVAVVDRAVSVASAHGTAAVALPALPYGASGEHAHFPGTVSIGTEALAGVLVELGRSLTGPCAAVVFASGHGGNAEALAAALDVLNGEGRAVASWAPSTPGGDAHAGRTETSLVCALDPSAVRPHADVTGDTRPLAEIMDHMRREGVRAVSPTGVLGDPAGASAAEGEELLASLAADLAAVIVGMVD